MCADNFRARYVLSGVVADDVSWGGYKQSFLVYRGGKILTVVFVARILRVTSFHPRQGNERCQSIKFRFFRDADIVAARALVYGKAEPPERKSD